MDDTLTATRPVSELDTVQRLQNEIAALKAELQASRSATRLEAPQPRSRSGQTFDFLGLPRELRNAIYELCVVVGEVRIFRGGSLDDFDMRYKRSRDPKAEIQLFCVNKQIRSEALELYLSKNHFLIPAVIAACDHAEYVVKHIPGQAIGDEISFKHLRSISISLDGYDEVIFGTRTSRFQPHVHFQFGKADDGDDANLIDAYHERHTEEQVAFYREILINLFSKHSQLRNIQINLENASCALGCHRLIYYVFNDEVEESISVWSSSIDISKPHSLDFLGTVNDYERQFIMSYVPSFLHDKVAFHGRFIPDQGGWDPDVEVPCKYEKEDGNESKLYVNGV